MSNIFIPARIQIVTIPQAGMFDDIYVEVIIRQVPAKLKGTQMLNNYMTASEDPQSYMAVLGETPTIYPTHCSNWATSITTTQAVVRQALNDRRTHVRLEGLSNLLVSTRQGKEVPGELPEEHVKRLELEATHILENWLKDLRSTSGEFGGHCIFCVTFGRWFVGDKQ